MIDSNNYQVPQMPPANYSGVTIHVNNPSVTTTPNGQVVTQTQQCTNPCCNGGAANVYPYYQYPMPPQQYPPQYYMNNYNYPIYQQPNYSNYPPMQPMNYNYAAYPQNSQQYDAQMNNVNNNPEKKAGEQTGKEKRVVVLTNEYIMSLENYLNNPNKDIRKMAAKEVISRLYEDKTRYDDAALNALLNKMLQDPNDSIKALAMSAFSSQLASGNDYTVKLLQDIQNNPNSDKNDVIDAANILLLMSGDTKLVYVPDKPKAEKKNSKENELNQQQIQQLREQLQKYKEKEIEQQLAQQMGGQ